MTSGTGNLACHAASNRGCHVLLLLCLALPALALDLGPVTHNSAAEGNVAADSSLEAGLWQASDGALVAAESARSGMIGARIERTDDSTDPRVASPVFPVAPGRWLVSCWLRTRMSAQRDPNYSAVLDITWLDDRDGTLGTDRAVAVNGLTHVWVYREAVVTAPAGAAKARLCFRFNWPATGLAELDDVAVTPAPLQATGPQVSVVLSAAERIFEPGKPLAVVATVRLADGPPRRVKLKMQVTDSRGSPLTSGEAECEAHSDRDTRVTITAQPAELPFREHLVARVSTDPRQGEAQQFGLLVVPRPTDFSLDDRSPFALLEGHPYIQRWLGGRWQRPNFNWNEREMELAKRYGVIYVGMIGEANAALEGRISLEEYGAFVYESVGKFKRLVKYWQQGNEPNLYQPGIPERWTQVLRVGYEAAKRADPDCKVLWGGITGLDVDPAMVDKLLAAGGGQYTDIIDLHLYVPIAQMDQLLTRVKADMRKHGVDKPITITEMTANLGTTVTEREKAAHVYKRYAVAAGHGVLASFWFVLQWVNTGEFRYCSLIDPGTGEPHEGAAAYAAMTDALEGARFVGRLDCGENAWVYCWSRGDRAIYLVWAEGAGATGYVGLPCGKGPGTVTDVAGHRWLLKVSGSLGLNLRDEPLLVDLPAGGALMATAPGSDFDPPEMTLARGATARMPTAGGARAVMWDVGEGLSLEQPDPDTTYMRASPDAPLGDHWVISRSRADDGSDRALLRLKVRVTNPLSLALSPLPSADSAPALLAQVTNLSPAAVNGTIGLLSPISGGPRPDRISVTFGQLAPGLTGAVTVPLEKGTDPLGRYEFSLSVETNAGVRETLRRMLVFTPALRAQTPPVIDGQLDDWPGAFPVIVGPDTGERGDPSDGPPTGPADLSARAALRWDDASLYLAVRVRDDIHLNDQRDGALWDGDGLQLGIAPEPYSPTSAYYEWGVALPSAPPGGAGLPEDRAAVREASGPPVPQAWSWRAVPGQPTGELHFPCKIVRGPNETIYELAIPWTMLPPISPQPATTFGFCLCVNERDTGTRGYYCWHAGIAGEKDRMRFGQVTLVE